MLAQTTQPAAEWVDCLVDLDYEICTAYPYDIRRKSTGHIVSESLQTAGYPRIKLSGKDYLKHRVVAIQFIPNPHNYTDVDHINHDRTDYHIENLRWCTATTNNNNRASYNGVEAIYEDELSENAIEVTEYGAHKFEFLWFDDDKFYYYTGVAYRELNYHVAKSGSLYVQTKDTNRVRTNIYLNKFKQINKL